MAHLIVGLAIVASSWASQATAQESASLDWRVAVEAGLTLSEAPYGAVTLAAEQEAVAGLSLGLRATGAGKLFDISYGLLSNDLPDPETGVPVVFYPYPDEWAALETTASVKAQSGAMVIRAQVGAGATSWRQRERATEIGPMMTGAVGLDLYPIRAVGLGVQAEGALRGGFPYSYTRISLGLRVRV